MSHIVQPTPRQTVVPEVSFFVNGKPLPQPRPRAFAVKMGAAFTARMYDPGTTDHWKACVVNRARVYAWPEKWTGAVELTLNFCMPRPKYHMGKLGPKLNAPSLHIVKPDADNLAKCVMDALTASGCFWHDDGQVSLLVVRKTYSADPGVLIQIKTAI